MAINIYDLNDLNKYTYYLGVGIFHSGLEVHGREYSFGGHDYASSGIFEVAPREAPSPARFRCTAIVGYTELTTAEVAETVTELGEHFHGNMYHLLERNCNSFVESLCLELTGKLPPLWVNRLARLALAANSCAPCILPASIRAVASTPSVPPPNAGRGAGNGAGGGGADAADGGVDSDEMPLLQFPGEAQKRHNRTSSFNGS